MNPNMLTLALRRACPWVYPAGLGSCPQCVAGYPSELPLTSVRLPSRAVLRIKTHRLHGRSKASLSHVIHVVGNVTAGRGIERVTVGRGHSPAQSKGRSAAAGETHRRK